MRIAIVGGIGSGKSEALKVAREMGIAALSADEINAQLLATPDYIEKIEQCFPECVVCGVVDKPRLSAEVFSDPEKRLLLNSIAHPEIVRRIDAEAEDPLVVELPLLLESGMTDLFDEIILICAPRRMRFSRLEARGIPRPRARKIIRAQAPTSALRRIATRTIDNSGSLDDLRSAVGQLLRLLCE